MKIKMNQNKGTMVVLSFVILFMFFYFSYKTYQPTDNHLLVAGGRKQIATDGKEKLLKLQPIRELIDDTEIFWQKPKNPKGILLLFHGCTHSGLDFFTLPEEKIIVRKALEHSFVVISFTSLNRETGCWQSYWPVENNQDVLGVSQALQTLSEKNEISNLPKFAFGASSGGQFVSLIWHKIPLQVGVIQIFYAKEDSLKVTNESNVKEVIFSLMEKDTHTLERVKSQNIPVTSKILELEQLYAYPTFFSDRIEGFSKELSIQTFNKLVELDVFKNDDEKYYMIKNPRKDDFLLQLDLPERFVEPMREELQLLNGVHELSSQRSDEWIETMKGYF